MSKQHMYRSGWAIVTLMFMVTGVGCGVIPSTVTVNQPTASALPSASPVPSPASVETTPTTAPVSGANVLYQDDFTDPVTGWPEDKFDNYFIGYHEPEYYHIEITSPNYKTTVFAPEKRSFSDETIELQVLTVSKKTAFTIWILMIPCAWMLKVPISSSTSMISWLVKRLTLIMPLERWAFMSKHS